MTMTYEEQQSDAKRARLSEPTHDHDGGSKEASRDKRRQILLEATRIESYLASTSNDNIINKTYTFSTTNIGKRGKGKAKEREKGSRCLATAWSKDDVMAIEVGKGQVCVTHLSTPNQLCLLPLSTSDATSDYSTQTIRYLSFSPKGEVLLAIFSNGEKEDLVMWARSSEALNRWEWRMESKDTFQDNYVQGRANTERESSSQYLGDLTRSESRGPQVLSSSLPGRVAALVISEGGQVGLIQGDAQKSVPFQISIDPHLNVITTRPTLEKVSHASFGLVPNESLVLLACRVKRTFKSMHGQSGPSGVAPGDALGMFFDNGPSGSGGSTEIPRRQHLEDDQDRLEMFEIKVNLVTSTSSPRKIMTLRRLAPAYLTSFDDQDRAGDLMSIGWLESPPGMHLIASYRSNDGRGTLLQSFEAKREEVEKLSDAFFKLENAKAKAEEEKEDWVTRRASRKVLEGGRIESWQQAPSGRIVCVIDKLEEERAGENFDIANPSKSRKEICYFDESSLEAIEGLEVRKLPAGMVTGTTLSLSPNGVLAMAACSGPKRTAIFPLPAEARCSREEGRVLGSALLQGHDVSDIDKALSVTTQDMAQSLGLAGQTSLAKTLRLLEVNAALDKDLDQSRLVLELATCFRHLYVAKKDDYYDCGSVFALLSHLEWLYSMVEEMAKAAYLQDATTENTTSSEDKREERQEGTEKKASLGENLLSLMTLEEPRKLLVAVLKSSFSFLEWLQSTSKQEGFASALMDLDAVKDQPPSLYQMLSLARNRAGDVVAGVNVDLEGMCGLLSSDALLPPQGGEEGERKGKDERSDHPSPWWTFPPSPFFSLQVQRLASEIVRGDVIRDAVGLFIKPDDYLDGFALSSFQRPRKGERQERDILSKTKLDKMQERWTCLRCGGTSHLIITLPLGAKCLCGGAWWA